MKTLFIIIDGLGDKAYKKLGNKTPFGYANKPNIDVLMRNGKVRITQIIKGIAPESDEAMLALLGYDVYKVHKGRGVLEAYGAGLEFEKGDVVLRANFARFVNGVLETESTPSKKYLAYLKKIRQIGDIKIKFIQTVGHRAVLILHGKGLNPGISNTNPTYKIVKNFVSSALHKRRNLKMLKAKAFTKEAEKTAGIVNEFTKRARFWDEIILLRGASNKLPKLRKMKNWALISEMPVEIGIGKCAGMWIVRPTKELGRQMARIVLTADHATRCDTKAHSSLPVPFIVCEI
ncbi:hypothetical protein HZB88_03790 [archaeon]|nr:hypothetical protein [archaeon]